MPETQSLPQNNQDLLLNYIFFAFFESKSAAYAKSRPSLEKREASEILQFIFTREITDKEYYRFMGIVAKFAVDTLRSASVATSKLVQNKEQINNLFDKASDQGLAHKYRDGADTLKLLALICYRNIFLIEGNTYITPHANQVVVDIDSFKQEYAMLFECISLYSQVDVYFASKGAQGLMFDPTGTFHEVHQGFTHLTRHVNGISGQSNGNEVSRFQSHIRRAALDFLKITIESLESFLKNSGNLQGYNRLNVMLSGMKDHEVLSEPSTQMHYLIQEYKSIVKEAARLIGLTINTLHNQ